MTQNSLYKGYLYIFRLVETSQEEENKARENAKNEVHTRKLTKIQNKWETLQSSWPLKGRQIFRAWCSVTLQLDVLSLRSLALPKRLHLLYFQAPEEDDPELNARIEDLVKFVQEVSTGEKKSSSSSQQQQQQQ